MGRGSRHSKNAGTMGSESQTAGERSALGYGTVRERLGKEALGNFYDCRITLRPAEVHLKPSFVCLLAASRHARAAGQGGPGELVTTAASLCGLLSRVACSARWPVSCCATQAVGGWARRPCGVCTDEALH